MYWRLLGAGHLLQIESSTAGVTWGLGYDLTPWVYTGGWGGAHFKGVEQSKFGIHTMEDTRYFYVYENQRWNPLTGFTAHGLPTDRYSWSDRSGRTQLTKDGIKLPSIHWQWTTDWLADYYTPGGVDKDAWQYATDFPASYQGKCGFTDYVRRRRWARKAKLTTSGPWKQLGSTKLIDIAMKTEPNGDIHVWAIATNGEALYRQGVSTRCPEGVDWIHVKSDAHFQAITIGEGPNGDLKVWAVGKDGSSFLRHGVTDVAPTGQIWLQMHPPSGTKLKTLSAGSNTLWALDVNDKLYQRQEITPVFPEGTSWHQVPIVSSTNDFGPGATVRSISATGKELWGVLDNVTLIFGGMLWNSVPSAVGGIVATGATTIANQYYGNGGPTNGVLARLRGITTTEPTGAGWDIVIGVKFI